MSFLFALLGIFDEFFQDLKLLQCVACSVLFLWKLSWLLLVLWHHLRGLWRVSLLKHLLFLTALVLLAHNLVQVFMFTICKWIFMTLNLLVTSKSKLIGSYRTCVASQMLVLVLLWLILVLFLSLIFLEVFLPWMTLLCINYSLLGL